MKTTLRKAVLAVAAASLLAVTMAGCSLNLNLRGPDTSTPPPIPGYAEITPPPVTSEESAPPVPEAPVPPSSENTGEPAPGTVAPDPAAIGLLFEQYSKFTDSVCDLSSLDTVTASYVDNMTAARDALASPELSQYQGMPRMTEAMTLVVDAVTPLKDQPMPDVVKLKLADGCAQLTAVVEKASGF